MSSTGDLFAWLTVVLGLIGYISIRRVTRAFGRIRQELNALRRLEESRDPTVKAVMAEYDKALGRPQGNVNPSVIVDRAIQEMRVGNIRVVAYVRNVRTAISLSVVIGLLGTFFGLYMALRGLNGSLMEAGQQASNSDMSSLLSQLRGLLGGMGTAFQASMWGVGTSAALTLFSSVAGTFTMGDQIAAELEHYLIHEYVPQTPNRSEDNLMREVLLKLEELTQLLARGLTSGLSDAADRFSETAEKMGVILGQIEPITTTLGSSGESLDLLGRNLSAVTADMHKLLQALTVSQASLPERMQELTGAEVELVRSLGELRTDLSQSRQANEELAKGVQSFRSGTSKLDETLSEFQRKWPDIMQAFVTKTEQAVERNALGVSESIEGLRQVLEQERGQTMEALEELVTANSATAQAVAASLQPEAVGSVARFGRK